MAITSIESLRQHLQTAIELEHSTLPPYLCALYSLKEGSNDEARAVLQSVALEEMLHLTLAANILNAVGGAPALDSPRLLPSHPTTLPHSDGSIVLSLRPFSRDAVEGFMAVERPAPTDSASEDENYATIGQFYRAIDEALVRLSAEIGEAALFSGDPSRQVTDALYYGGAGRIITVTDLASARRALREIVVADTKGLGAATSALAEMRAARAVIVDDGAVRGRIGFAAIGHQPMVGALLPLESDPRMRTIAEGFRA
jgi:hypothetical protein